MKSIVLRYGNLFAICVWQSADILIQSQRMLSTGKSSRSFTAQATARRVEQEKQRIQTAFKRLESGDYGSVPSVKKRSEKGGLPLTR